MSDAQTEARAIARRVLAQHGFNNPFGAEESACVDAIATALAAKDAELKRRDMQLEASAKVALDLSAQLAELGAEVERLKDQLGDPEGVIAHADAIIGQAEALSRTGAVQVDRQRLNIEISKWAADCDLYITIDDVEALHLAILAALEPAAPEGRQEAGRIGDAVLDWMVKFDLRDAGNEYCVSDVLAVLNDLAPSTRPTEQAVTEAMVEKIIRLVQYHVTDDDDRNTLVSALKAAMEARNA